MELQFKQCEFEQVSEFMERYIGSLSSPFDSYLDDHIFKSQFYKILKDSIDIGYFAIHENTLLTQFYIEFKYLNYAQNAFKAVRSEFNIQSIYVYTADELLLSLSCDIEKKEINNQAYFFQDNKLNEDKIELYEQGVLRMAEERDIEAIKEISKDFFDDVERQVKDKGIYVFIEGDVYLGFGIAEKGKVLKGYTSIGMFTNTLYRQKGIGRTIITKLKELCYENGEIPICGCWYYNFNSKKTLESCGFISKTRLLNIKISL